MATYLPSYLTPLFPPECHPSAFDRLELANKDFVLSDVMAIPAIVM